MRKRITKRNWYSDELESGKAKIPIVAPSDENHLEGINRGEIQVNDNSEDPTIFIRDNKGNVVQFKPGVGVGGSAISEDIIVSSPQTGCIKTGDLLPKGLTYEQIFRKMLLKTDTAMLTGKISTANDVEFGSKKGTLTYTATRNGQGEMKKAYYDSVESNALVFSTEVNGAQTATRVLSGNYTQNESYDATVVYAANGELPELPLSNRISVNVRRKWFAGVCSTVPTTSAQVRALGSNGLYTGIGSYKFTISNYQTFVICIPSNLIKEVKLERYVYNFMDLDSAASPKKINVEGANGSESSEYTMYVFSSMTVSPETDNFTFKTV